MGSPNNSNKGLGSNKMCLRHLTSHLPPAPEEEDFQTMHRSAAFNWETRWSPAREDLSGTILNGGPGAGPSEITACGRVHWRGESPFHYEESPKQVNRHPGFLVSTQTYYSALGLSSP